MVGEAFVRIRPDTDHFRADLRTGVSRDVRQVERSLASTNREFARFGRGALVGTGALGGLGRAAAFASATFIGGAGLTYALKSTVAAAEEAQVVQGQLENALDNLGISFRDNQQAIEARTQALSQMSGFDDELITTTFTNLVRRTGDVTKAMRLNAIAVDVARGRNISLESASSLVTRASLGMAGALRRVGIAAREGASATELLELLQRKYAGSAERYGKTAAGAQQRFAVALENTQEIIGAAILPSLTRLLNKATAYLNNQENQKRIQDTVNSAVDTGTQVVGDLANGYDKLRNATVWVKDHDPFGGKSIQEMVRFGRASLPVLEELQKRYDDLADSIKKVAVNTADIEAARTARTADQDFGVRRVPLPRPSGRAFVGRPLTEAQQLELDLSRDPNNETLLRRLRAQQQRRRDFAQKNLDNEVGNTKNFLQAAKEANAQIVQINDQLAGIAAERAAAAQDARDKVREAEERRRTAVGEMIRDISEGVELGVPEGPLSILQVNQAQQKRRRAQIEALLGTPERAGLELQIAEARFSDEDKLVPFIQRELTVVNRRLALLKRLGATRNEILQQTLLQQQLKRRLRDINAADNNKSGFSLTDFFSEAAKEQALYGSNVGTGDLSGQDARASVGAIATAPRNAAKAALAGAQIVQNFWGDMPNPAQALQQASQAARALRY